MDGKAWWATVHGVMKSRTRLSNFMFIFTFIHWRRKWQPTPVFLPGESQGWRSLVGCHLWGGTELHTTNATQQQEQQQLALMMCQHLFMQMVTKNFLKWMWLYQFIVLGTVYENSTSFTLLSKLGIFYLHTICSHLRTNNAHCSFKYPDKETAVS